ncbi:hypothetical protein [Alloalcanivorax xenomutans]|uniref:hypothetical protein n=1 Tax=Alloalcanivorax xenomutans TaxID=1094342 RepID=UPI003C38CA99
MFQYNDPTATAGGEFTDGNSQALPPVARTVLRAHWPNMIQRELLNVLMAGGVTPEQGRFDQVAQAIKNMVNETGLVGTLVIRLDAAYGNPAPGYIQPLGQILSRETYSELWAYAQADGTVVPDATWTSGLQWKPAFSDGDGETTFRAPDLRDIFFRVLGGTRTGGSYQADENKGHVHTGTTDSGGLHSHPVPEGAEQAGPGVLSSGDDYTDIINAYSTSGESGLHSHPFTTNSAGGNESRPVNFAYPVYIRYRTFI